MKKYRQSWTLYQTRQMGLPHPRQQPARNQEAGKAMTYPTILVRSASVLEEVAHERARQDAKWGEQNHPNGTRDDRRVLRDINMPTWGTICYRARNLTDAAAKAGTLEYLDVLLEEVAEAFSESDPAALRAELIQVAAVAVAWAEKIDRDTAKAATR